MAVPQHRAPAAPPWPWRSVSFRDYVKSGLWLMRFAYSKRHFSPVLSSASSLGFYTCCFHRVGHFFPSHILGSAIFISGLYERIFPTLCISPSFSSQFPLSTYLHLKTPCVCCLCFSSVSDEDRRQGQTPCLEWCLTHGRSSPVPAAHVDIPLTGLLCVWPAWTACGSVQVPHVVCVLCSCDHRPFLVVWLI